MLPKLGRAEESSTASSDRSGPMLSPRSYRGFWLISEMMSFVGNRVISSPPSRSSDLQRTLHARDGVAAEPDRAAVELHGDPAVTAEAAALSGDIRLCLQHAVPAHERRHAPVAAS